MLEKLFTSKNRVKLLEFFLIENGSGGIREVSKKKDVSVSVVSRELNNFVDLGILRKEREVYFLNENCNICSELRGILVKTDSVVFPIQAALPKKNVDFAFIFGSFAKGGYGPESDIDLMVVGNVSLDEVIKKVSKEEKEIGRNVNPVVWTVENLKKEKDSAFVKDIFTKGILMVKGDENELREIVERK
ncbi:MAG: nucleotidyltransferase domain-containing protein [Candidatus Pacearchaeota archaeon]